MPQSSLCRLCTSSGHEYKTLFDDNGKFSRIFKIAMKYFDPILLISGNNHTTNVICVECWQYIEDFYRFQQVIINSQAQLEFQEPFIRVTRLEDELFKEIADSTSSPVPHREEIDDKPSDTQFDTGIILNPVEPIRYQKSVVNSQEQLEDLVTTVPESEKQTSASSVTVSDMGQINDIPSNAQVDPVTSQPTALPVFELVQIQDIPSRVHINNKHKQLEYDAFIAKWKGELKCLVCKRQFPTYSVLSRHFRLKHRGIKCYIACCGRKIMQRFRLVDHIQKYHIAKPITIKKCKFCSASLTDDGQLRKHILKFHREMFSKRRGEFKCEMCTSAFTREDNLRMHYSFKHKGYPLPEYNCNKCTMTYKSKFRFENHMKKHHSEELNKEEMQDIKPYTYSNNILTKKEDCILDNNQSKLYYTFKNKEQYHCNMCEKSFAKKGNLILHKRRKHDDQHRNIAKSIGSNCKRLKMENDALIAKLWGKLECVFCKRLFDTFTLLNKHFQDQHCGKQCHIVCCSRKLYMRSRIIKHIHEKHNERTVKSYKCLSCTQTFYENDQLRKHVIEMHKPKDTKNFNEKYKCDICLKAFGKEHRLREHYRLRHKGYPLPEHSCSQCDLIFQTQYRMEEHIKKEHINESIHKSANLPTSEGGATLELEEAQEKKEETDLYNLYIIKDYTNMSTSNNVKQEADHFRNLKIDNFKNSASEEEAATKFLNLKTRNEQIQQKTKNITQITQKPPTNEENIRLNSPFATGLIIKEEISIYPSDEESQPDRQSEFNTSDYEENDNKELTFDFFTNSTISKATNTQYDAFIHKWKGDLECPKCPREMYENFSMLREHFRIKHDNERPFILCCNLKLISRYPICAHLCLHLNPNAYQCDVCRKSFKTSWNLRSHKSHVHGNARWCKCYKQKLTLNEYDMTTVCCKRKKKLLANDAKMATFKKELECWQCKSKFPYYSLLHNHFQFEHPKEKFHIECCAYKFYKVSEAIKHFLEHSLDN